MMPNTTSELRRYYCQQSQDCDEPIKPYQPSLLQWPEKSYLDKFKPDADLLQTVLSPLEKSLTHSIADQVFGNQKQQECIGLKHDVNLFYERSKLHSQHMQEIGQRHIEIQGRRFGVEINNAPDRAKCLSNWESQLLQLEQQRRDEELAFWKDTVDLRQKLFEGAGAYRAAQHRYSIFSAVEGGCGS